MEKVNAFKTFHIANFTLLHMRDIGTKLYLQKNGFVLSVITVYALTASLFQTIFWDKLSLSYLETNKQTNKQTNISGLLSLIKLSFSKHQNNMPSTFAIFSLLITFQISSNVTTFCEIVERQRIYLTNSLSSPQVLNWLAKHLTLPEIVSNGRLIPSQVSPPLSIGLFDCSFPKITSKKYPH